MSFSAFLFHSCCTNLDTTWRLDSARFRSRRLDSVGALSCFACGSRKLIVIFACCPSVLTFEWIWLFCRVARWSNNCLCSAPVSRSTLGCQRSPGELYSALLILRWHSQIYCLCT